ncbi:MAG: glycosyltransferase family 9 protein [Fimbriimonadaceae bacterium]|nr:glycosyltransferase family 9 protein [Fimbriimonadaceae bacterium]
MRALIVRLSAMGDVVCGLPAASSLAEAGHEVTWVVDSRFAALPQRCANIHQTVGLDKRDKDWRAKVVGLGEFDIAIDLQGLFKSGRIVGAAKAALKLAYHRQREFAGWFAAPVRPDPTSVHVVDQYVDVARAAGGTASSDFALAPTDEDRARTSELLSGLAMPYAVVNAGGAWATKRWPPRAFARVSEALYRQGIASVYIGSAAESEVFAQVAAEASCPLTSLHGKTGVGDLVGLMSGAKLHLGGDTGTTHIAAALGTPCVGLYMVTRPERSCPYRQISHCQTLEPDEVAALAVGLVS